MSPGFVIVTFKCRAYALACLASMQQHLPAALEHTVIVDNASGDDTLEAVKARFPAVRTLAAAEHGLRRRRERRHPGVA
ncbi:MAG TPA: hypothetical protein VN697_01070 [Tepidiformaceae bacterium]|nr:hypothetical protein [Tepidiformaceae bacterium]